MASCMYTGPSFHMRSKPPTRFSRPVNLGTRQTVININWEHKLMTMSRAWNVSDSVAHNWTTWDTASPPLLKKKSWLVQACPEKKETYTGWRRKRRRKEFGTYFPCLQCATCPQGDGTWAHNLTDCWRSGMEKHSLQ